MKNEMKCCIVLIILFLSSVFFISTGSARDDMTTTSTDTTPGDPGVDAAVAAALAILTIIAALIAAEREMVALGETPERAKQKANLLGDSLRPLINSLLKKIPDAPTTPVGTKPPAPPTPKTKTITCHYCSGQKWTNCDKCGGTGRKESTRDGHTVYNACECFFHPELGPEPGHLTCTVCKGTGTLTIPVAPPKVAK
jgi:hypothetical protein